MNKILVTLFVCVVGLQVAVGQLMEDGKCPKVKPVTYFDLSKNFEPVYVYGTYEGPLRRVGSDCIIDQVSSPGGHIHSLINPQGFLKLSFTREYHYPGGDVRRINNVIYAKNPDPTVLGKFDVVYEPYGKGVGQVNVLEVTNTYKVAFYCKEIQGNKHLSQVIVYTKTPSPSLADVAAIKLVLRKNGLDYNKLKIGTCERGTKV